MADNQEQWWINDLETAELIWCAANLRHIVAPPLIKEEPQSTDLISSPIENIIGDNSTPDITTNPPVEVDSVESPIPVSTHSQSSPQDSSSSKPKDSSSENRASGVRIPDPFPLPSPAEIGKALLPLAKRVAGLWANELDIEATVEKTAEANGLPIVEFRQPLERWFEIHLLVDRSPSMMLWDDFDLAQGVATLFRWQGFFRDVRVWQWDTSNSKARLFSGTERIDREIASLIAPHQNRLFIVLTDTLGKAWRSGCAFSALALLGKKHSVTIAHIFPHYLWQRTALAQAIQRPLIIKESGNLHLSKRANSILQRGGRKLRTQGEIYQFPILNLQPNHFATWANFIVGGRKGFIQGVLIKQNDLDRSELESSQTEQKSEQKEIAEESSVELLRGFLLDATPKAQELARILAAVPLIPPVMRLAQRQFLENSEYWHLAEVFFSGLLQKSELSPKDVTVLETWYEFKPKIRDLLLESSPVGRTIEIWREIGALIEDNYGSFRDFQALIPNEDGSIEDAVTNRDLYFAEVDASVFMTWGGEYARYGQELRQQLETHKQNQATKDLLFKTCTFDVATIDFEETFEYQYVTVSYQKKEEIKHKRSFSSNNLSISEGILEPPGWKYKNHQGENFYFHEKLIANKLSQCIDMVYIPEGKFMMGTDEEEIKRLTDKFGDYFKRESPRHEVNIQSFYMSKYPITQRQWQMIAQRKDLAVNEEMELSLQQSRFKQNPQYFSYPSTRNSSFDRPYYMYNPSYLDYPVEQVNWYQAKEFCDRLSKLTGKKYRLPTEAEWEYACRAVSKGISDQSDQPFHFGQTITTDLANYDGMEHSYTDEEKGVHRKQTTPVGMFPPNAFGIYDLHGNVLEWCEDDWHDSYQGQDRPDDGTAWLSNNNSGDVKEKALRGGSWNLYPHECRSAYRFYGSPHVNYNLFGFRVVCEVE